MRKINSVVKVGETDFSSDVSAFLPKKALIPFGYDAKYKCTVAVGDYVQEGQIVAVPSKVDSGDIDSAIHSSIPGKVIGIEKCCYPNGRIGNCVQVELEGSFSYINKRDEKNDWKSLATEDLLKLFLTKGIVNTFGEPLSLTQQILSCKVKHGRFLVVRMFDEDPSRLTDTFVASHYTKQVLEGVGIVAKALNAEGIIFAVSKKSPIKIYNDVIKEFAVLTVPIDNRKYPTGFKEDIIRYVKKYVKDSSSEFFGSVSNHCVFVDPETLFAVYEAVVLGIPVMKRFVHVTGSCLNVAAMFRVRIGTTIGILASHCGQFNQEPAKIITNGLVVGSAVSSLDMPILKTTKSIMFVPSSELYNQVYASCIRCGKCRQICPQGLYPDLIAAGVLHQTLIDKNLAQTSLLCSGCCLCNSACPSRLPLSQAISIVRSKENYAEKANQ